jgi:mono/diheme cytochrome c family protein
MRIGSRARSRALACAWLAWLALASGCRSPAQSDAPAAPPVDATLAELGEPYFRGLCASCHGAAGAGDGPAAAALRTPPADLTRIAARRGGSFPDAEIAQFVDGRFAMPAHGSREMPVWGEVFTREIAADSETGESVARGKVVVLVEYLKSIQVPPLSPPPAP